MAKANAAPQQLENLVKKQFKGGTDEPGAAGPLELPELFQPRKKGQKINY